MAELKVTQKDERMQEAGLRLIVEGGQNYEKPSINQILDEIEFVIMTPIRAVYRLMSHDDEAPFAESLLFVTLDYWDRFTRDVSDVFRKPKKPAKEQKSIFNNDRFFEYVSQIKIDGHDPADILEAWLKEHKPDYFND